MKALNNFLDKASLFKVFIFGWIFTGGFTFLIFTFFSHAELTVIDLHRSVKIGILSGIPFGVMFMLMISTLRKDGKKN